jgi:hypothetical protein
MDGLFYAINWQVRHARSQAATSSGFLRTRRPCAFQCAAMARRIGLGAMAVNLVWAGVSLWPISAVRPKDVGENEVGPIEPERVVISVWPKCECQHIAVEIGPTPSPIVAPMVVVPATPGDTVTEGIARMSEVVVGMVGKSAAYLVPAVVSFTSTVMVSVLAIVTTMTASISSVMVLMPAMMAAISAAVMAAMSAAVMAAMSATVMAAMSAAVMAAMSAAVMAAMSTTVMVAMSCWSSSRQK